MFERTRPYWGGNVETAVQTTGCVILDVASESKANQSPPIEGDRLLPVHYISQAARLRHGGQSIRPRLVDPDLL